MFQLPCVLNQLISLSLPFPLLRTFLFSDLGSPGSARSSVLIEGLDPELRYHQCPASEPQRRGAVCALGGRGARGSIRATAQGSCVCLGRPWGKGQSPREPRKGRDGRVQPPCRWPSPRGVPTPSCAATLLSGLKLPVSSDLRKQPEGDPLTHPWCPHRRAPLGAASGLLSLHTDDALG